MMSRVRTIVRSQTREKPVFPVRTALQKGSQETPQTLRMDSGPRRPTCPNCSKPAQLCLCRRIRTPGLDNPVSVVILQHSLERKHALNSTRIAKLGLKNVSVTTVSDVDSEARFLIRMLGPESRSPEASEHGKATIDDFGFGRNAECTERESNGWLDDRGSHRKTRRIIGSSRFLPSKIDESANDEEYADAESSVASITVGNGEGGIKIANRKYSDGDVSCCGSKPMVTATIRKHGAIADMWHSWMLETHENPLDFKHILSCKASVEALSKGFVITKLQSKHMESEEEEEFQLNVPAGSVLLFPSEEARNIHDLKANGYEIKNLIVLDGTWAKSKRMYLENPWLKLVPHLALDLDLRSLYGEVRRQPKAGFLSTIESIVYAMKAVGKCPEGVDDLLEVFESMVEDQRRCKDGRLRGVSGGS